MSRAEEGTVLIAKYRNLFLRILLSFLLQLALARRLVSRDLDEIVRAKRPHPA